MILPQAVLFSGSAVCFTVATVLAVFVEHFCDRHSLHRWLWRVEQLRLCLNDDSVPVFFWRLHTHIHTKSLELSWKSHTPKLSNRKCFWKSFWNSPPMSLLYQKSLSTRIGFFDCLRNGCGYNINTISNRFVFYSISNIKNKAQGCLS